MRNPINRLFVYGLTGLAIATAIVLENYMSGRNTLWEYVIGITLFIFSLVFLIGRYIVIRKNK